LFNPPIIAVCSFKQIEVTVCNQVEMINYMDLAHQFPAIYSHSSTNNFTLSSINAKLPSTKMLLMLPIKGRRLGKRSNLPLKQTTLPPF